MKNQGERTRTDRPTREASDRGYSTSEMMIVASARQLAGERVCFVGVGPPNIACNLAKRTVAPELELVYESGVFGSVPARLPLSIGDPTLVSGSLQVTSMFDLFAYYLQAGLIDVGFLGASQIDRYGNINTTVIGEYDSPKVRLPGSGGACEIAINARKVFVIMPQSKRSFVERIDFTTSPGHLAGGRPKGWLGVGPSVVVTGLGVFRFDQATGEMYLASRHPDVSLEEIRDNTSWDLKVAEDLQETPPPTEEELGLIRQELDPEGAYTR
jgi:glutaconate CoA-transferase subunit B